MTVALFLYKKLNYLFVGFCLFFLQSFLLMVYDRIYSKAIW